MSNFQVQSYIFCLESRSRLQDQIFTSCSRSTGNSYRSSHILGRLLSCDMILPFKYFLLSRDMILNIFTTAPQNLHWSDERVGLRRCLRLYLWRGRGSRTLPQLSFSIICTGAEVVTMSMMVTIVMVVMVMKMKSRRWKRLNYGLNFYDRSPRTIFSGVGKLSWLTSQRNWRMVWRRWWWDLPSLFFCNFCIFVWAGIEITQPHYAGGNHPGPPRHLGDVPRHLRQCRRLLSGLYQDHHYYH